jgi:hypothetical protein
MQVMIRTLDLRHEWIVGHRYSEFDMLRKFVPFESSGGGGSSPRSMFRNRQSFSARKSGTPLSADSNTDSASSPDKTGRNNTPTSAHRSPQQSPHQAPPFPKKTMGTGTDKSIDLRQRMLQDYLQYLVDNRGFGDSNLILALLSFLEVCRTVKVLISCCLCM